MVLERSVKVRLVIKQTRSPTILSFKQLRKAHFRKKKEKKKPSLFTRMPEKPQQVTLQANPITLAYLLGGESWAPAGVPWSWDIALTDKELTHWLRTHFVS